MAASLGDSYLWENCKGVCEDKTWSVQLKNPRLLEAVTRERLGEDTAAWKGLVCAVVIRKVWKSAMALELIVVTCQIITLTQRENILTNEYEIWEVCRLNLLKFVTHQNFGWN
jgi:hypothetical protein